MRSSSSTLRPSGRSLTTWWRTTPFLSIRNVPRKATPAGSTSRAQWPLVCPGRWMAVTETPWLLNVNVPNMPLEALRPIKLCRLGRRHSAERVIVQESPRGEPMYWIGGAGAAKDDAEGTDFHATAQGHVSVTPLKVDLTDHDSLGYWAQTASRLVAGGAEAPDA